MCRGGGGKRDCLCVECKAVTMCDRLLRKYREGYRLAEVKNTW